MQRLSGRVAVVTGAGRGLGRSHALTLAAQGAAVVVNDPGVATDGGGDNDSRPAAEVVTEICRSGGQAVATFDSCADWSGAEHIVSQAIETFGSLDILVNNAGIMRDRMSFSMSESEWDAVIDVHLKGHFAMSHFAGAHWRAASKRGEDVYGRIVNTTSESGLVGMTGQVNYIAAKAGITAMTIAMARELAPYGVTVNAIAPRARTRMTEQASRRTSAPSAVFDDRAPENVSPVVAWLASAEAVGVTGQILHCYGSTVSLLQGWRTAATIDAGEQPWTVDVLAERAMELFGPGGPQLPSALEPLSTPVPDPA